MEQNLFTVHRLSQTAIFSPGVRRKSFAPRWRRESERTKIGAPVFVGIVCSPLRDLPKQTQLGRCLAVISEVEEHDARRIADRRVMAGEDQAAGCVVRAEN